MLCGLLKVSTSGYYAWVARPPSAREVADGVLTIKIQTAFEANRKVYGAPRIQAELADADVHVGRKRIARLMREAGIVGCHRRKHKKTDLVVDAVTMAVHRCPVVTGVHLASGTAA